MGTTRVGISPEPASGLYLATAFHFIVSSTGFPPPPTGTTQSAPAHDWNGCGRQCAATHHLAGFVLIRAADFSVKSAQLPRPYRQALIKTIWRGSGGVGQCTDITRSWARRGAEAAGAGGGSSW